MWNVAHPVITGTEMFELRDGSSGFVLGGWVVAMIDQASVAVSYEVEADRSWLTRRVAVTVHSDDGRSLLLEHDGEGGWTVDGVPRPDLATCRDVDLGVSPSTNTLPIRRLGLEVGDRRDLDAAWVRFPLLSVEVLSQTYERLGEDSYRYSSPGFQRDLVVDDDGVVLRYGDDLWQAVVAGTQDNPREADHP